jgi:hypothetical protein
MMKYSVFIVLPREKLRGWLEIEVFQRGYFVRRE